MKRITSIYIIFFIILLSSGVVKSQTTLKELPTISMPKVDMGEGFAALKSIVELHNNRIIEDTQNLLKDRSEMEYLSLQLGMKVKNSKYLDLYREAATWIGTRYRWAGSSKKGTDCSGLTGALLKKVYAKEIARSSHVIANNLQEELEKEDLQPGDLVFFSTLRRKGISHVGVYLGEGHFIHASRKGVVVSNLDESYYAHRLKKAGRI